VVWICQLQIRTSILKISSQSRYFCAGHGGFSEIDYVKNELRGLSVSGSWVDTSWQ
jgi:hypothetical protein